MPTIPPPRSIRKQLWLSLTLMALVLAGTSAYTLYELDLRRHDYLILNLAGQMRVATRTMLEQSRQVLREAELHKGALPATTEQFYRDALTDQMRLMDQIIEGLRLRHLSPALTGRDAPIQCTWDTGSRSQMALTATAWLNFRSAFSLALGEPPHAQDWLSGARFVGGHGEQVIASVDDLAIAFQHMMESKLDTINRFQIISAALLALMLAILAYALQHKVLGPLRTAVQGFERVARGALGHQLAVSSVDELGQMTQAFNSVSERMRALFHLTDRINQGKQLEETLDFILREFPDFVPVDWVGVLYPAEAGDQMRLERLSGPCAPELREGRRFVLGQNALAEVVARGEPLAINDLAAYAAANPHAELAGALAHSALGAALYMPLNHRREGGVMVFAARQAQVYTPSHIEFLSAIAGQVGHIVERTLVVEGLVVAALQGFAKLAESRDPETGDHLERMARYSVVLAEEMAGCPGCAATITPAYVRALYQFAPMHDIGKVGIADSILLKPGRLDEAERREMERHPAIGGQALRRSEAQMNALGHHFFGVGIEIAECHHEKWDGSGYPAGLSGEAIPLSARIVAVADVFDALTSKRPYKEAWPVERALAAISDDAGRHFDPEVVAALQQALPRIMAIYDRYKHV